MYGFLVLNVDVYSYEDSYHDYVSAYQHSRAINVLKFYCGLPRSMRNELKHTIWIENGRSDNGMGVEFGDHMIEYATNSPVVRAALRRYLSNFGVDTSINS